MKLRLMLLVITGWQCCAGAPSPAEVSIEKAQERIAQQPGHYPYYNELAMAYARRARETSDVSFYEKAEGAVGKSLAMAPDNFGALKVETWLLLGRHEFAKARESAEKLNRQTPDDVTVYGYLVDANVELGNYDAAVPAAQWMLNLRPGNIAGLTRAAYLRELHGDLDGAVEFMQMAYDATPFQQTEDRAWLLAQLAHLKFTGGDLAAAERYANGALEVFPGYHYALGALAQVRTAQGRHTDAVELLERRYRAAPHAENLYALAEALERAGRTAEAGRDFAEFERRALAESTRADNANHELVAYYVDHAHQPAEALKIVRGELGRRHDVFTVAGYAWALAAAGDYAAAESQMSSVLRMGVKDPAVLEHAKAIARHEVRAAL